eukprot:15359837-Ditylum_brightwellii.AAC.1
MAEDAAVPEKNSNKRAHVEVNLYPHGNSLRKSTMITSLNDVSLKTIERENQAPSNKMYLDIMLLCIILPSLQQNNQLGFLQMYGPKEYLFNSTLHATLPLQSLL